MTHTYSITNLNCTGCVGHIKEQIEKHPNVTLVDVSLEQSEAVINMGKHVPIAELQSFLDKDTEYAGRYIISQA
ncbi:MAG: heavy-metal-associated domain-containing protein [Flavobacteriales bacterium]|nr:heavy-metal-associated domain-containing protein [Flavobacteriales bacterium]